MKFPGNETLILRAEKQQERIQKFQKGGAGSQILERGGGRNSTFQCGFQSFSYKSLTNIPAKGGPRPVRPLP